MGMTSGEQTLLLYSCSTWKSKPEHYKSCGLTCSEYTSMGELFCAVAWMREGYPPDPHPLLPVAVERPGLVVMSAGELSLPLTSFSPLWRVVPGPKQGGIVELTLVAGVLAYQPCEHEHGTWNKRLWHLLSTVWKHGQERDEPLFPCHLRQARELAPRSSE